MLGVSADTVQSWEQGVREPSATARRLLEFVQRDRERFMTLLLDSPKDAISAERNPVGVAKDSRVPRSKRRGGSQRVAG
jgi:predicted transcriptional regulator